MLLKIVSDLLKGELEKAGAQPTPAPGEACMTIPREPGGVTGWDLNLRLNKSWDLKHS